MKKVKKLSRILVLVSWYSLLTVLFYSAFCCLLIVINLMTKRQYSISVIPQSTIPFFSLIPTVVYISVIIFERKIQNDYEKDQHSRKRSK